MPDPWANARDAAGRYSKSRNAPATEEGKKIARRAAANRKKELEIKAQRKNKK